MASIELDSSVKQALRHLHSNARDSAERVRALLDELIRLQCGSAKTMACALPKKYLTETAAATSTATTAVGGKQGGKAAPPAVSPQQIRIPEGADDEVDGELAFELLEEDLTCLVCRQIACTAANRLVECESCRALYHQECHKPAVRDGDVGAAWRCFACYKPKPPPPAVSPATVAAPPSSAAATATAAASKAVVPNINIISADKRLQIMKKKAAKQQENKRKHSK